MKVKLKPISDQVVVVLGASSGMGREIARRFAARGARVLVAARSEPGLVSLVGEIEAAGGVGGYVVCDVADFPAVQAVAEGAVQRFGRIDTWVNVAGVSIYSRFEDTTPEQFRRVTDITYLGQIYGALAALPHLRRTGGGALIAISSVAGIVSLPLQAAYSASKHAVEGAIDALRRELMSEGVPISVTSVKPGTINTPFFNNAANRMDVKPQGPPPIYDPGVVADCVLYAAEHPVRDLFGGGAAKMMAVSQTTAPKLVDTLLAKFGIRAQRTAEPAPNGIAGNLDAPRDDDDRTEGDFSSKSRRFSLYSWLETHPQARMAATGGMLVGAAFFLRQRPARHSQR